MTLEYMLFWLELYYTIFKQNSFYTQKNHDVNQYKLYKIGYYQFYKKSLFCHHLHYKINCNLIVFAYHFPKRIVSQNNIKLMQRLTIDRSNYTTFVLLITIFFCAARLFANSKDFLILCLRLTRRTYMFL